MANVLITGAGGFLGQHVTQFWLDHNKKFDRLFTPRSHELELIMPSRIREYVRTYKIDSIVHLAALCGGIGANQKSPGSFIYQNIQMGINVLEAARMYEVKKVILLGTVCMYPKFTPVPFKETDLWNGYPEETNAPYGIAKKAVMEMGQAYCRQYGMDIMTLIPTNLVGPFDHFEENRSHVIPALIKKVAAAIKNNDPSITVWGDGSASREFLYAGDCAEAIFSAAHLEQPYIEPINIGNGVEVNIEYLVHQICNLMQYHGEIIWDKSKPNGQPYRCLDTSVAKRVLNFKAKTSLTDALAKTIEYARDGGYV